MGLSCRGLLRGATRGRRPSDRFTPRQCGGASSVLVERAGSDHPCATSSGSGGACESPLIAVVPPRAPGMSKIHRYISPGKIFSLPQASISPGARGAATNGRMTVSDRDRDVRCRGDRASARDGPPAQEMTEMQYLISVIDDTHRPRPPRHEMAAIDEFNDRLAGRRPLGLRRRPRRARHRHRHRQPRRGSRCSPTVRSSRPKEYVAGFWIIEAADLDVALALAADGRRRRCNRKVEVRPFLVGERGSTATDEAITRAHREEWARVVAALTRRFGDLDIAEEAAAEAFATAVERWPVDGVPPNPGAWLTTTANRKAIDRIRRENKRDDKQREARMLYDDDPPEPLGADRRRPAAADLHLLPPGARDGGPRRADAAHGRRADRARDRPRLPGAGGHDGPADHPRQGQDRGGPHPLPGAVRARTCRRASRACSPSSSSSSTRATWRPAPTPTPSARDLTAEAIRLTRLVRALLPRGRRGGRAAGADAPHRGPPHRPGLGRPASWSPSTSRTAAPGTPR